MSAYSKVGGRSEMRDNCVVLPPTTDLSAGVLEAQLCVRWVGGGGWRERETNLCGPGLSFTL